MPTRAGVLVALGAVITLVAGRIFGLGELSVVGSALLVLPIAAVAWVRRPAPQLEGRRTVHPARVQLGSASRVDLEVVNVGTRRSPVLTLHDPVEGTVGARVSLAPLAPGSGQQAGYRLPTDRRGVVRIGPLAAEVVDPFGLAHRRLPVTGPAELTVLPGVEPLPGVPMGGGRDEPLAGVARRAATAAASDDLATLRPYVIGDDLRRVHWPSSARTGELVVRQDDVRWQGHATVILDLRADRIEAGPFEVAVSAAASVLHAVGRVGDRARLLLTDGTDSGLVDARPSGDLLLELLALAERTEGGALPLVPNDGRVRTGTLVVVTGTPTATDLEELGRAGSAFGRVVVIAVAPSVTRPGAVDPPLPAGPPGVEVARVDAATPFAAAWRRVLAATGDPR